jgi:uncharacterized repeat protein (TIGR04076 family)
MRILKISVSKILGTCTADPPLLKGENFFVSHGDIFIPGGGSICLWALQSLLPLVPAKERKISEQKNQDWMWRVHHIQCPDPDGRVVFRIDRLPETYVFDGRESDPHRDSPRADAPADTPVRDLRIIVDEIRGHCTSRWRRGDAYWLRSGRLYIPSGRFLCLYALQSILPFLAAKQRRLEEGDWLKTAGRFLCPDPAGNVILRLEPVVSKPQPF